ncbi:chloride channel protein [Amycolatopsis thermoflava]|uniref:chloride channel protein n=1 Tax=Amycolatopsis thermoflava TaxID=84480 RepID=UPI003EBCCCCA
MRSNATTERRTVAVPARQPVGVWLRESSTGLAILAVAIGAGAGLGAVEFRWLITGFTQLFSGHADYSAAGGEAHPWFPALGPWFLLIAPVLAGLVYGPLVYRFAPEARGHGVPEVMYAVAERGGRIPAQVTVVKALASAMTIGSGGSVGREGPIVQIGSALGSTFGRWFRLPEGRLRILVACGAAGGIAATFNAPMAGPFFAMELILRDFAVESFGAVVLSSVTASVVGRAVFGDVAFLDLPPFTLRSPVEYLLFVVLGVVVGACGVLFTKVLYWIEDACDWAWRGPEWLRPAAGGLLLGGLLLLVPQMYGVGYPVLQNAVEGRYVFAFLLLLMVAKMVATSLTIGIGGSGGVFAPSLFIGAMGGTAFGIAVHTWLPATTASPGVYGLIGMGAAFAGAARAPITAVIILFELTGQYTIILPLMTAIVIATLTSKGLLRRDTIYTLKLRRRGVDLEKHPGVRALAATRVSQAAEPLPQALPVDTPLDAAARALALSRHGILPVTAADGRYQGCVTARAVAEALGDDQNRVGDVGALAELPPLVTEESTLDEALDALGRAPSTGLPVLDRTTETLTGWINHEAILAALHAAGRTDGADRRS